LVVGCWLLVAVKMKFNFKLKNQAQVQECFWLLAIGYWLLAIGYWL